MLRRRPVAVGCVLAAVALVVTTPVAPAFSAAQDVGKAQELRNPLSSGGASSARSVRKPPHGMIEALQRDLGLTAQEAQARLDNEIRYAPIEARLRRELGAGFGGSWLEGRVAQVLIVATTDLAAAPLITTAGAQPKIVARSLARLTAVKDELDKDLAAAGEAGGFARYVDVRTNQVVIRTTVPEQTRNLVGLTGVSQEAVRVEASARRFRPLYDLRGGDAYRIDSAWRCSVGFSATKGAQNGFVSAGHCGDAGSVTTGYNNVAQGVFECSSFPGDDHSWITVNTNWRPTPDVVSTGGTIGVTGSREAIEGASVCRSGSTTGWHCGTVRQRDVTVVYDETQTVSQLTLTDACAEPGDSGGPFVSVDQAQGVLSGGNGNCTAGGETVFQPVTEILSAYGVSLVVDEPVPPETGCACPCYPRRVAGTLSVGGLAYQPSGSYYRTTAYRLHTGCLEGPAGSDFDLYLQRWNGRSWVVVASDTGPAADKSISYLGAAGRYRYRVNARTGSGPYTLGYTNTAPLPPAVPVTPGTPDTPGAPAPGTPAPGVTAAPETPTASGTPSAPETAEAVRGCHGGAAPSTRSGGEPAAGGLAQPEPECACPCYRTTTPGTLALGRSAYLPSGGYYRTTATEVHLACLDGPDGSDFDLYLQRWNGRSWVTVASETGPNPDETLRYQGPAGRYRYRVTAASGSGGYTLGYQHDLP